MDKLKVTYEVMLGLAAEMVLDEAVRIYRSEEVYKKIDRALANRDKIAFTELTSELRTLK
ncbi:IDEAL domain-containing protein [Paenibacillus sp. FA6]|uniref:IDEAL domain-containing protein n=1 Tax=Paenibacillus sp. FA6 TaxID=3413029 RepID=UPI003F65E7A5